MLKPRYVIALVSFYATFAACRAPAPGEQAPTAAPDKLDAALLSAVREGQPQEWANALRELSHAVVASPRLVVGLAQLLRSPSAETRSRAAMALGALGSTASGALPELLAALSDPDFMTRAEAVFALGAVGIRSEEVLRGLFVAATSDRSSTVTRVTLLALNQLGRYPIIAITPAFQDQLRVAIRSESPGVRSVALRTAMRAEVPWAREEFTRLLSDPNLRVDAAYALAGVVDSAELRAVLAPLERDTVEWVREIAATLSARPQAMRDTQVCSHRAARTGGPKRARVMIEPSSISLRDDGKGPYLSGAAGVRGSFGTAFNFFLPDASPAPGIDLQPARNQSDPTARALVINLSLSSAPNALRYSVRDAAARLHVFYMRDARGVIWNLSDIPVGATIESDRTQLNFFIDGRYHVLQFGAWALGDCGEDYAAGVRLGGEGSTPVKIQRVGDYDFRLIADARSLGRLWDVSKRGAARDLGLYRVPFALRFSGEGATRE